MPWYDYLAYFFAGAFLTNSIPHFVQGVCGNKFQSPFASPSGIGESSAIVNVVWGWLNFVVGSGLLVYFSRRCRRRPALALLLRSARSSWRCSPQGILERCATAPPPLGAG